MMLLRFREPGTPIFADTVFLIRRLLGQFDHVFILPDLDGHTGRRVPRNVAMHNPDTRIVGLEPDGEIAATGEQHGVAPWWVLVVEGPVREIFHPEIPTFLGQNHEIVAVQVDGVGNGDVHVLVLRQLLWRMNVQDDVDPVFFGVVLGDQ